MATVEEDTEMFWITRNGERYAYVGSAEDAQRVAAGLSTMEPDASYSYRRRWSREAQLVRLGGEYERAEQTRDYSRKLLVNQQIEELGAQLDETHAWWLLVIRGRNIIRRCRQQEDIHY